LVGLVGRLLGLLLLLLLLHGLLLLLLLSLLLHGLLLLLLLGLLAGNARRLRVAVIVVIAAANQGETGCADAGAARCPQQGTSAHLLALHSLPIVAIAH